MLKAMARGLLNKQIAWELKISEKTVKMHRALMIERLGVGLRPRRSYRSRSRALALGTTVKVRIARGPLDSLADSDSWRRPVRSPSFRGILMRAVNLITLLLLIVGGLNWGLVGLFGFDLVAALFGEMSALSRIVYALVGLSALWQIVALVRGE